MRPDSGGYTCASKMAPKTIQFDLRECDLTKRGSARIRCGRIGQCVVSRLRTLMRPAADSAVLFATEATTSPANPINQPPPAAIKPLSEIIWQRNVTKQLPLRGSAGSVPDGLDESPR